MPRRLNALSLDDAPPKKKYCSNGPATSSYEDDILIDVTGKTWRLGKPVGVGGFGQIYLASDNCTREVKTESPYVAKVEGYSSGPLFVEINCYLRIAKESMIDEWIKEKNLEYLGMPHYVASGSYMSDDGRKRFLILPRFENDLEKILTLNDKKILNLKTVLTISCQIIDVLEYIHSKGYIHSDIKASNILFNVHKKRRRSSPPSPTKYSVGHPIRACRITRPVQRARRKNLRPVYHNINYSDDIPGFEESLLFEPEPPISNTGGLQKTNKHVEGDRMYLLDYGLASKYVTSSGEHKPYGVDERKAHAGTLLFCSRDAHKGVQSRRSDLESLGYNIIYWLIGSLPWIKDLDDPVIVEKKKHKFIADPEVFLKVCFEEYPKFLMDYFRFLQNLEYQEKPDYDYCKRLFKRTLREYGYKDNGQYDFENLEGWGKKQKKLKRRSENLKVARCIYKISRPPLRSNIPLRPYLREKKEKVKIMKWSQILVDPETIIRERNKKSSENNNDSGYVSSVVDIDIDTMNPTYAMLEVYNKCYKGTDTSGSKGDCCIDFIEGYTPAMMYVYKKMNERKEKEYELLAVSNKCNKTSKRLSNKGRNSSTIQTNKSTTVIKKDNHRTRKTNSLQRTYSLRG